MAKGYGRHHGVAGESADTGYQPQNPADWAALTDSQIPVNLALALDILVANSGGGGGGDTHPIADSTAIVKDPTDATKLLRVDVGGNTTGVTGVLAAAFSTAKTVTLPDATDTLVGKATTDTLTNKSIAAGQLTGSIADARVAQSNVTQHEAAIDHDALANFVANEHKLESAMSLANLGTRAFTNLSDVAISALSSGHIIHSADGINFVNVTVAGAGIQVGPLAGDVTTSGATATIANNAVTSAKIADGTIVNADINGSAAIASSKLATVALAQGGTGQTAQQAAIDALTAVGGATTGWVLTKSAGGNAVFEASAGGGAQKIADPLEILNPSNGDEFLLSPARDAAWDIEEYLAITDTGTCPFRINIRTKGNRYTSSANYVEAQVTATTAGLTETTFSIKDIAADEYLVVEVEGTPTATLVTINLKGVYD